LLTTSGIVPESLDDRELFSLRTLDFSAFSALAGVETLGFSRLGFLLPFSTAGWLGVFVDFFFWVGSKGKRSDELLSLESDDIG
jgi:hypothetical protein